MVQDIASTTEASLRDAEGIGPSLSVHSAALHTRLRRSTSFGLVHQALSLNSTALVRPICTINAVELRNLCYVFPSEPVRAC